MNIILDSDSYKASMHVQYPEGTEIVHSHIMAREGAFSDTKWFGFQAILKNIDLGITQADIDEADEVLGVHGVPFHKEGWQYIMDEYNGQLPLRIRAVPEGKIYKPGTVLASVENTDPKCYWLTTYVETMLLRVWYPSTVATISYNIRQVIKRFLEETGDVSGLDFKLHDFGSRGVSSPESAGLGGMAHLTNFKGSDTLQALLYARRFYDADMAGYSIPAMEHSTVTSWGEDGEEHAFRNMLNQYSDAPIIAAVSDSYDLDNAVLNIWGGSLLDEVKERNGIVVVRPDSGDPVDVVLRTVSNLGTKFGYEVNDKGYKVLNHVRVIQGDGIDQETIENILTVLTSEGWSADNIAFGMGGALLQHCDRDWGRWAMKCSAIRVNGEWRNVRKNPKTDPSKASPAGRFEDMPVVWENGHMVRKFKWEDVTDS